MERYYGVTELIMDVCKVNIVEAREYLTGICYVSEEGKEIFLSNQERCWAFDKVHDRRW